MTLIREKKDGVLVVQFTSQKILSDTLIARIGIELLELVDEADGKMVLDFHGVEFMSSAMAGKIVLLRKKCRDTNTIFKVCNVNNQGIAPPMAVFEIMRIDRIIDICNSLGEALKSFQKTG